MDPHDRYNWNHNPYIRAENTWVTGVFNPYKWPALYNSNGFHWGLFHPWNKWSYFTLLVDNRFFEPTLFKKRCLWLSVLIQMGICQMMRWKTHFFMVASVIFFVWQGCDIGGAKELGVMYFPTNWGAKEPQNLPNWLYLGKMNSFWLKHLLVAARRFKSPPRARLSIVTCACPWLSQLPFECYDGIRRCFFRDVLRGWQQCFIYLCFFFRWFCTDSIPWDENHHEQPPFEEYGCIFSNQ